MAGGITENDVWAACDALLLSGARPTIERVRQRIGRGSPNTVSPYLDTWFRGLGGRIKDPAAFAAPPDLPDPVMQSAKHFWEVALAETRVDFDRRLEDGLAAAVANVESEKERASLASAAAFEASAKVSRLQVEIAEQGHLLETNQQELAAERARLEEVRSVLAEATERLRRHEEKASAEQAELRRQVSAALDRADAADRRVLMDLERSRTARAKAEQHAESLQKSMDSLREKGAAASELLRRHLEEAREREAALAAQLAASLMELDAERRLVGELRAAAATSASTASSAHAQFASLQASFDRLATRVGAGSPDPKQAIKELVKRPVAANPEAIARKKARRTPATP